MELDIIQNKIFAIRSYKVLFDFDLAEMYGVKTKVLKQAVRRNLKRFPADFMFELADNEWNELVTNCDQLPTTIKHSYIRPMAFTEQGVAMLSSILKSDIAIDVNIKIMRAFVRIRELAFGYAELNRKVEDFMKETNMQFGEIYQAIAELSEQKKQEKPLRAVGYTADFYKEIKE